MTDKTNISSKIMVIVQARSDSKRLPGKVLMDFGGITVIESIVDRLTQAKSIDQVVVATSSEQSDDKLAELLKSKNLFCFRGSKEDVLSRFVACADVYKPSIVLRVTGDCPLIDPVLVDALVSKFLNEQCDYMSNALTPTLPDGFDCEIFTIEALLRSDQLASARLDREHVTKYIYENRDKFIVGEWAQELDLSRLRLTLDYIEDYELLIKINSRLAKIKKHYGFSEVAELYHSNPDIFRLNSMHIRNDGLSKSSGQKLWGRAQQIIPGGSMLLSKNPNLYLPGGWPCYFKSAKGCKIVDLDDNEYLDFSIMGIGTNTLGYGHPEVDDAVVANIRRGNMSTLNCAEEVLLTEELLRINPWAGMARYARTGGEANAIAIRIARAAAGKSKVAVCGYHGWHDWYLAANLGSSGKMSDLLIPGLKSAGVPEGLKDSITPFYYNDYEGLKEIIDADDIGVVKIEIRRYDEPENDFLKKVRTICSARGIILIVDECTSGFRETFGGMYQKYGIEPDMVMYGKTLGNGYAITAVLGRLEIMEAAKDTFISSTFFTERIGPTAALKTLEVMERDKSWEQISDIGKVIQGEWSSMSSEFSLDLDVFGYPAITGFSFQSDNNILKTLITQEMLKQGIMATNIVYVCMPHANELDRYFSTLRTVFKKISRLNSLSDARGLLDGPEAETTFSRLN